MKRPITASLTIILCILGLSATALGQVRTVRHLSDSEQESLIGALMSKSTDSLSEDPSCRSDLSHPGSMSIAEGIAHTLTRAANESKPVVVTVDCFDRTGYPRAEGQEWCRVALLYAKKPRPLGFGLVFRMNWKAGNVAPGSVECFGFD